MFKRWKILQVHTPQIYSQLPPNTQRGNSPSLSSYITTQVNNICFAFPQNNLFILSVFFFTQTGINQPGSHRVRDVSMKSFVTTLWTKSVCSSYCTNNSGFWSWHWSEREAGGQGQQPDDCPGRFVNPLVSRETWNTCMRTARELHLTCWLRLLRRTRFLHNLQFRSTMCPSVSVPLSSRLSLPSGCVFDSRLYPLSSALDICLLIFIQSY